ncbi:MAG: hypothetical protein U1A06_11645 [Hoeflea sp.]|nr:hypothetical protein [Hoeflea sp.]
MERSIRGALRYLDDTQIRDRPGLHSSLHDYCDPQLRSCARFRANVLGEWSSIIYFLPDRLGDGVTRLSYQDSNAFVTASILFPLYFIDDHRLPENERLATRMRSLAAASLAEYKRGEAYNFWVELNGETSAAFKTGPMNLPIRQVQFGAVLISYPLYPVWKLVSVGLDVGVDAWIRTVLNPVRNPHGFDSVFNIPNDADDTAKVVAIQKLHNVFQPGDRVAPDRAALKSLTRHRDVGRVKGDKRNAGMGSGGTGAFLTWLKDENLETFAAPEEGIIPLGVNNVDCVVNANALFSLALNDARDWPGFDESSKMLAGVARTRAWTNGCALYYPQLMMLPYALSRAYREGSLFSDPSLREAMGILLQDLLEMQRSDGSFPGGKDKTRHLSTALATSALLNIGGAIARDRDLFDAYQAAIAKAVRYLVSSRRQHRLAFSGKAGSPEAVPVDRPAYKWDPGLFFTGSYGDLAHWRSEAYTTAMVLEALVKFELAYDLDQSTLLAGRRLRLEPESAR